MKIGVMLNPDYNPQIGGGFSYYSRLITGIDNYHFSPEIDIVFLYIGEMVPQMNRPIIALKHTPLPIQFKDRVQLCIPSRRQIAQNRIEKRDERKTIKDYCDQIKKTNIQIIYYPIQTSHVLPDIPFIVSNWDIGHRSAWMFPELMTNGEFEWREYYYNTILPQALMILCESEAGRQELASYTRINMGRIKVMPLFSNNAVNITLSEKEQNQILSSYNLTSKQYFYYPAQFWAHKNHYTLLHSFASFIQTHPHYKLIFTGSDQGNQEYIESTCHNLGIAKKVIIGGFVKEEIVSTLYRNATALVMPTILGPTNMPLLEAMQVGCPVICSDLPGHREELAESAIYVNPLNPAEILSAMEEMVIHQKEYIQRIQSRKKSCQFTLDNALQSLNNHLLEAIHLRSCWG